MAPLSGYGGRGDRVLHGGETDNLLEIQNLTVEYHLSRERPYRAIDKFTFSMSPGQVVGILGESGSGKTTLALAILRLLPSNAKVTAGAVLFRGQDLLQMQEAELAQIRGAHIGIISQEPATALNPVMRVGDQITEVIRAHRNWGRKRRHQAAAALLREVRLPNTDAFFSSYAHELSGGQRQRVSIAQALACRPALVIADEPATALDTTTQAEVFALMKDLRKRFGMAMILITHDPATLTGLADRVVVVNAGKLIEEGSPAQICGQSPHPYTRRLLASVPPMKSSRACDSRAGPCLFRDSDADTNHAAPSGQPCALPESSRKFEQEMQGEYSVSIPAGNQENQPLLLARHISRSYRRRHWFSTTGEPAIHALTDVDLAIWPGLILGLVGESGSGKSTLARCLAGLEQPDSGEILFGGRDLFRLKGYEFRQSRRAIQLLFQDSATALNPWLTLEKIVAEPLTILGRRRKERREIALALMQQVGLPIQWSERKAAELSGGQRQRLAIARALAAGSKVVILDEALSGLDLSIRAQIIELLLNLQVSFSLAYLFISHDLRLAGQIADEIAVMQEGRIVEHALTRDVFMNPQHASTQSLLKALPALPDDNCDRH